MGPDCRQLYGVDPDVDEATREEANKIIHMIALQQKGKEVLEGVSRLFELGVTKVAQRVLQRLTKVVYIKVVKEGWLSVRTPWTHNLVENMHTVDGRWWDKMSKCNMVPMRSKHQLWEVLKVCFPGELALGPKGIFKIPEEQQKLL